jgi:hypothetical protein
MAFSPSGKVLCVGVQGTEQDPKQSLLQIYVIPTKKDDAKEEVATPTYTCMLDTLQHPLIGLVWHVKLNQLLVATTKEFQIWYSSDHSKKGVLLSRGRRRKRTIRGEDDLQQLYTSRAPPPGSTIRQEQIITPNALPLFGGVTKRQRKQEKEDEETAKHIPQKPSKPIYNTPNTIFAQMVMDNRTSGQKQIAGMDPREALAEYSEGKSYISHAYEGNIERILTDKTVEQEEEAMLKGKKK